MQWTTSYSIRCVPLTGDDVGRSRARARLSDRILSGSGGDLPIICNNNTAVVVEAAAAVAAFVGRGSGSTCATIWMSVKQTAAARRPPAVARHTNQQ